MGRVRLNSVRGHLRADPSCGPDPIDAVNVDDTSGLACVSFSKEEQMISFSRYERLDAGGWIDTSVYMAGPGGGNERAGVVSLLFSWKHSMGETS
jgi:hypothetical protein